ncbi:MAG TPA: hypothetical protein VM537_12810 [Anaerolineae bacterium]|nr:hypothetical protein [Anaerolineae bacterium]
MKFSIGYQLPDPGEPPFAALVADFRNRVDEVYFAWLDMPSGRSPIGGRGGFLDWTAQSRLERDLAQISRMGVKLDLLLNASCYGRHACSQGLKDTVSSLVAHLLDTVGLSIVTTMSPVIAQTVKREYPMVEVRASVNMRLGTIRALEYVAELFDSFHVQREFNRDLERLHELRAWADAQGKRLLMLANSGCLSFCSVQTFHDNLVAHEAEVSGMSSLACDSPALCWSFYRDRRNWVRFLQNTWVRPEDIGRYEGLFPVVKLATRMHADPRAVIEAYSQEAFAGNLPDLFEPGHGPVFVPYAFDNARFPADWFEQTSTCGQRCHACAYCASVLEQVLVEASHSLY